MKVYTHLLTIQKSEKALVHVPKVAFQDMELANQVAEAIVGLSASYGVTVDVTVITHEVSTSPIEEQIEMIRQSFKKLAGEPPHAN